MEPSYRLRLYLLTALVLVGFGALLSRLYDFQIVNRDHFLQLVPGNRTVTVREPGIRGEITDRNGITLARNLRNYEVSFNLDEVRNAYLAQHDDMSLDRVVRENGMTRKRTERDIVSIVKNGPLKVLEHLDPKLVRDFNASNLRTHYLTHAGLVPFSYRADLSYDEFAKFAEHNLDLPGVYLSVRPLREYPFGSLASHELGYLKQWEKGDVPESDVRKFDHYIGDDKGVDGVEASMDEILRGLEGVRTIMKDEKGRTIRPVDIVNPGMGAEVRLTIDAPVQYLLENTLRLAGRCAGVIMDPNTGEVLAMASVPDYNPNDFIPSISQEKWDVYRENPRLSPLTNRAISAYAPGSTMKIPTAIAGELEGMGSRNYSCEGYMSYGNSRIKCWIASHGGSHGGQNLSEAIQHSCNPYFNKLANAIGWKAMVDGCQMVGIGQPTGIELPGEKAGILPGNRPWRAENPGKKMTGALTAMLSIGQADTLSTPLQICAVGACVANGGKYYKPRIVKEAIAADGDIVVGDLPILKVDLTKQGISPEDIERIRHGMWLSTNKPGGTSGKVRIEGIEIASKSGTAQTTDNGAKSNVSWILSFAPYDHPRYAICIMVQHAGSGGAVAGPLVNLVYRGLFARDGGVKLALKPQTRAEGHLGELVKSIEVPAEMIAAVEAGEPVPVLATPAIATGASVPADTTGETGDEAAEVATGPPPAAMPAASATPTPTITPEIDAEGSVTPRAIPVKEPR